MPDPQTSRFCRHLTQFAALAATLVAVAGCSSGETAGQNGTVAGTCSADTDCAALDDADLCNGSLRCDTDLGICKLDPSTVVACDPGDDTACRAAICEPATGTCKLLPRNEGVGCDDGEPCSLGDTCQAGSCVAGKQDICGCKADADCGDDGNLCNGTPYCDLDHFPYQCKDKPNSEVKCAPLDDPCMQNACDPKTGGCVEVGVIGGTPCDDGNPCTQGDACQGGKCQGGADTCSCQQDSDCTDLDGDPCTGVPYCDKTSGKGVCTNNEATVIVCSTAADTPCRKNTCNKLLGSCVMTPVPDGDKVACDDGDACTTGEVCVAGVCGGGTDTCKCTTDAECAGQDDGNLCNGTMFCNLQSGKCEVNPATVVTCPTVDDTACSKNVCIPKTGQCEAKPRDAVKKVGCSLVDLGGGILVDICLFQPKADGETADPGPFACEDGNPCTKGDICEGGACKTGQAVCECSTNADCAAKDDGDLCNGVLFCNKQSGKCEVDASSVVTCPSVDDTACLKNQCNPKLGVCQPKQIEGICDDGDNCTKGDLCKLGQCAPGTFVCECKEDIDCAGKDDGNLCNGVPFCDKTGATPVCKTNPATVVTCPSVDDTTCLKNQCQPKTGQCVPTQAAPDTPCDDGDVCTASDVCKLGQCQGGAFICECKEDKDCKDDGDLCNGVPFCDKSAAKPVCKVNPQTAISCPSADDTACLKNTCQKTSGACVPTPVAPETKCDDGDACTTGDVCKLGQCAPGAFTCECKEDVDCVGKDDGDPCNGVWFCDKSGSKPACKPQPNSEVFCPKGDDTACLKNTCDPKTVQCKLTPVKPGTACDDGEVCTVGEYCDAGDCKNGEANGCDDGNKCTVDSCDAKTGCKHTPKNCDDGNDCTVEACDAGTGNCSAPASAKAGTLCNGDNKGCTVGDACDGKGSCAIGSAVACKQPSDLCKEAVCQDKGGTDYACVEATRADGSDCDDATACKVGATCKAGKCQTATQDTLFQDMDITPSGAWMQLNAVAAGPGRDFYTGGSWRSSQGAAASNNAGFLWRHDVRGKMLWSRTIKGYNHSSTAVMQLREAPQDGVVAAAAIRRVTSNSNLSTRIVSVDKDNKLLFQRDLTQGSGVKHTEPLGIDVDASGVVVVAMKETKTTSCKYGTCAQMRLSFLSSSGVETQKTLLAVDTNQTQAYVAGQVAFRDADTVLVAGTRWMSNGTVSYQTFDAIWSASGKFLKDPFFGVGGKSSTTFSVVAAPNDAYATVVRQATDDSATAGTLQVALTENQGGEDLVYLHSSRMPRIGRIRAAQKGALVVGGTLYDKAPNDSYVGVFDKRGNEALAVRLSSAVAETFGDLAVTADDRILVARSLVNGSASSGVVARLSVSGHSSCSGAGVCVDKGFGACDDGKVCTTDGCNAKAGCQHTLSDSLVCDVDNGCSIAATCSSGTCQPLAIGDIRSFDNGPPAVNNIFYGPFDAKSGTADEIGLVDVSAGHGNVSLVQISADLVGAKNIKLTTVLPLNGLVALDADLGARALEDGKQALTAELLFWGTDIASSARRAWFVRRGAQSWNWGSVCTGSCKSNALAAFEGSNGETWTYTMDQTTGTNRTISAWRLSTKGSHNLSGGALNHYSIALGSDPQAAFVDAEPRPGGGSFLTYVLTSSMVPYSIIEARAYNSGLNWSTSYKYTNRPTIVEAIAPEAGGGLFVVGAVFEQFSGLRTGLISKLNSNGSKAWTYVASQPDNRHYSSAMVLADRVLVGGGTYNAKTLGFEAFLGGVDFSGTWQWERDFGLAAAHRTSLLSRSDGGIILAYVFQTDPKQAAKVKVVRTNAWGHTDCIAAGICGAKTTDDCDDGNPCTIDLCDAKSGCSHTKTSGPVCGTNKTCQSGVCK